MVMDTPELIANPWIALVLIAAATQHIRLGPMVTPLARRRPQKVARETVTLDHLSSGRLILGDGYSQERERVHRLEQADELVQGRQEIRWSHGFIFSGRQFCRLRWA
jgi:alkanesulfonate monooxygenase SsuD/methylene tetrahydromethanopterin reductase-like flavin-dependent oxidoreductase (luciferase family)